MFAFIGYLGLSEAGLNGKPGSIRPALHTNDELYGKTLSTIENEHFGLLTFRMNYDHVYLLANTNARVGTTYKPTGYVASLNGQTRFEHDAFVGGNDMFKGIARIQVTFPANVDVNDAYKAEAIRRLNVVIRDISPDPPRRRHVMGRMDTAETAWAPSLGKAGWIGLYTSEDANVANYHIPNASVRYWLIVVAGLDNVTYNDLDETIQNMKNTTIHDVCTTVFDDYRELAKENRSRLLALAIETLELTPVVCNHLDVRQLPFVIPKGGDASLQSAALSWCNLPVIPTWFRIPRIPPKGSPPFPSPALASHPVGALPLDNKTRSSAKPKYLIMMRDVCFYDVRIEGPTVVVYMGCTRTNHKDGVPKLFGPKNKIIIYNPDGAEWTGPDPLRFNAFPSDPIYSVNTSVRSEIPFITWENPELLSNRNITADYSYFEPEKPGSSIEKLYGYCPREDKTGAVPSMAFTPLLVRVSAYDPLELAIAPANRKLRFNAAHVDTLYKPL